MSPGDAPSSPTPEHAGSAPADKVQQRLRETILAARRAGPVDRVLEPLPQDILDRPIDFDAISPAPEASAGEEGLHNVALAIRGYTLQRRLNEGGQATVYLAIQESTGRRVAVKVMAGGPFLNSVNRARFEREVRALAKLDHPNIVTIIDRGRTEDGSFYLVTNFIAGVPLDQHIEQMRASGATLVEVARLFATIASAVHEAHRCGIVHRDLKPSNILVDARGAPHIVDFGLAQMVSGNITDRASHSLTNTGQVLGSLPWSSPEQASGQVRAISPATDIYAMGLMLYEAITATMPYTAHGLIPEVVKTICHTPPLDPRGVRNPPFGRIPDPLAHLVNRMLAKKPTARPQSAAELAEALEAFARGQLRVPLSVRISRWAALLSVALTLAAGVHRVHSMLYPPPPATGTLQMPTRVNSIGMTMVRLPAGEFYMGQTNDPFRPARKVNLTRSFEISATEVTRGQYRQIMGNVPELLDQPEQDDLPVTGVRYADAQEFCARLSEAEGVHYRLPTEAEWEYACVAGEAIPADLSGFAWDSSNSGMQLQPVATRKPNRWGLYDMLGNAAEWVADTLVDPPTGSMDPYHFNHTSPFGLIRGLSVNQRVNAGAATWRQPVRFDSEVDQFTGFRIVRGEPLPNPG
jgi:serine/threonine protein kinase